MNSKSRSIARRSAVSVGAAAAALLVTLGGSSGSSTVAFADPVPGLGPLPLSCTGAPIDAYTACAVGGHQGTGGNAGDGTGADTPVLGGSGGGNQSEGGSPPAG